VKVPTTTLSWLSTTVNSSLEIDITFRYILYKGYILLQYSNKFIILRTDFMVSAKLTEWPRKSPKSLHRSWRFIFLAYPRKFQWNSNTCQNSLKLRTPYEFHFVSLNNELSHTLVGPIYCLLSPKTVKLKLATSLFMK
jgi:hypothetical protein